MVTPSLKHPYNRGFYPGWKNKVLHHLHTGHKDWQILADRTRHSLCFIRFFPSGILWTLHPYLRQENERTADVKFFTTSISDIRFGCNAVYGRHGLRVYWRDIKRAVYSQEPYSR